MVVSFKFNFKSARINDSDLEKLFVLKRKLIDRKKVDDIISNCQVYGYGVALLDSLLMCLDGYISEAYLSEHERHKITISVKIPCIISFKPLESKIVQLSSNFGHETPLTAK